jgi:hypothetical protein
VVFAGDVADGEVNEREAGAEGSHEALHALDALFVVAYASFEMVEAAGLAYAHKLVHLALQYIQVGEDLGFEICHFFSWVICRGYDRRFLRFAAE